MGISLWRLWALVSIHAPYAGSDAAGSSSFSADSWFQSTPPMQGATVSAKHLFAACLKFQSTPPMQGATVGDVSFCFIPHVSIHAPYAGSDGIFCPFLNPIICFNPRPLCRERPILQNTCGILFRFQSTPPMQGATGVETQKAVDVLVSIHAPYAGSD